ncbi:MAG: PKD domain-containing protein, partial [Bacteroidetes bacterium]|nr:PKD domain-containing protein [Bacteroidota bacterium]
VIGVFPTYDFVWSNGASEDNAVQSTVTGLCFGAYTVTVTDDHLCTAAGTVHIHTTGYIPDASFIIPDGCYATDNTVSFQNNTQMATNTQFFWDFGDGTVYTGYNPFAHLYTTEGDYCVNLTVVNALCGSDEAQQSVRIIPHSCLCDENQSYDYPDDEELTNTNLGIPGETITINGTITIPEFGELDIPGNATLRFGPDGKIVVSRFAELRIRENVVLDVLEDPCVPYMWPGIEVWGNRAVISTDDEQGVILIEDNVTIANAHIGILFGRRNMDIVCNPYSGSGPFHRLFSGGVIIRDHGSIEEDIFFVDCGVGMFYQPKHISAMSSSANQVHRIVYDGGILLDVKYNNTQPNHYPNPYNPFIPWSNPQGISHIGLGFSMLSEFIVEDCDFNGSYNGIEANNGSYRLLGDDFNTLYTGADINNTNISITNVHVLDDCTFDNIPGPAGGLGFAVKINAGRNETIRNCIFGDLSTSQLNNYMAIASTASSGFRIIDNSFSRFRFGIHIGNSGTEGGYIGNSTIYDGNVFTQCRYAVYTSATNSALEIHCNQHNNDIPGLYTFNWMNRGWLADQGSDAGAPDDPAGNYFSPSNQNELQSLDGQHNPDYYYYHHDDPFCTPDPGISQIEPVPTGIPYVLEDACPLSTLKTVQSLGNAADSLKILIETQETAYVNLEATLDNGNTAQLLDAVVSDMANGQLKNLLLAGSPLSDTVIIALCALNQSLAPGNFKNVMEPNLPVSRHASPYFFTKLETLPPGIAGQLRARQGSNPGYSTLASIQRIIERLTAERNRTLSELSAMLVEAGLKDQAIQLWEAETGNYSRQTLASTYLDEEDMSLAQQYLSEIEVNDNETAALVELYGMMIDLYLNGRTLYEMDSVEEAFVRESAAICPEYLAVAHARSILSMVYGEDYPPCPPDTSESAKNLITIQESIPGDEGEYYYLGACFPNPCSEKTYITYYLPEEMAGNIIVSDAAGKTVMRTGAKTGSRVLEVAVDRWRPGIYTYYIENNGIILETRRMVVSH